MLASISLLTVDSLLVFSFNPVYRLYQLPNVAGSSDTYSAMLKDRDYDVTPHIILILSLTLTQNARGVGEGLRGVLRRWVLVGVVGVRSRWVGAGDP